MSSSVSGIITSFRREYAKTPTKLKVLDSFIIFGAGLTVVQFLYMVLVGTFPFNAFLAGFFSSLSFMVLTVCLRLQVDPASKEFSHISPERAFADYVLANLVLHLVVWNYIG